MTESESIFEESYRELLKDLASKMMITSWVLYLAGLSSLAGESFPSIGGLVQCVLLIALGLFNSRAASEFKLVAGASANYLEFLMTALNKLKSFYSLVAILVAFSISLSILLLVVSIFSQAASTR